MAQLEWVIPPDLEEYGNATSEPRTRWIFADKHQEGQILYGLKILGVEKVKQVKALLTQDNIGNKAYLSFWNIHRPSSDPNGDNLYKLVGQVTAWQKKGTRFVYLGSQA